MRQADSTIKGYRYQFDKSIYEILVSSDEQIITLEGQIEDIDIESPVGIETIQCKYHEGKDFTMSGVAEAILEMICHFISHKLIGGKAKYVLYAYYENNVERIEPLEFYKFLNTTKNQDILVKFFPQIYKIDDKLVLEIANKARKSREEKDKIKTYFLNNRETLEYKLPLDDFFLSFEYRKAEKHEELKQKIYEEFSKEIDLTTTTKLYYPNAFSKIAEMSSYDNIEKRKIKKIDLLDWLSKQKSVLLTKWLSKIKDRKELLKDKKKDIAFAFSCNTDIRAIVFTENFLKYNESYIVIFIIEFIKKYFVKKKLQKPAIFILQTSDVSVLNKIIVELFSYQITVNTGLVGNVFNEHSFVNNSNCATDFSAKLTLYDYINETILSGCEVNYLFYIGECDNPITKMSFRTECLGINTIDELRYLVGLDKTLKETL